MTADPQQRVRQFAINCTNISESDFTSSLVIGECETQTRLAASIRPFLTQSLSDASKRAYRADMRHFEASGRSVPCSPERLAAYLAEMAATHAVATIQRRIAGIAKAHRTAGFPDPTKSEIVQATLRGIKRTLGIAQREAAALQRDDLFSALASIGNRPIDVRDKALLLIGFAGAFRRSELVGLDCADIVHVRQGIVIHLRRSKTDQMGQGRKIAIPHGRTRWCPVQHLTDWLTAAGIDGGPIFRPINRHGHVAPDRLSGEAVSNIVKQRIAVAGFDPDAYSGHSLRAGLATSAAMAGASMWKIRRQTGHASDAMLVRYIRDGDMFTDNAAGAVL